MTCNPIAVFVIFTTLSAFAEESATSPAAWVNSHYGACYASMEQGMVAVYGPDYANDDNVLSTTNRYDASEMVLSQDTTSGTNSSRTVFEKRTGNRWCIVLTSPPVASIEPVPGKGKSARPAQWITLTQAPPGFAETKVVYSWSRAKALYLPSECYRVLGAKTTVLDCRDAYN